MQIELRSPCMSGPRWAPGSSPLVFQGSAGGEGGPARTFVFPCVPAGQTDRKDPQNFNPSLKFPPVFPAVCRNGRRAGGLLKAPPPRPTFTLSLPNVSIPVLLVLLYNPPPPLSSPPCYFLLPLLFLPSSVVLSVFAPSFPKRAPRPSGHTDRALSHLHLHLLSGQGWAGERGVGWWSTPLLGPQGRWVQSLEPG